MLVIMVRVPMVQSAIGSYVASVLSAKLGTAVSVGKVDLGLFNRIVIDDVAILDQQGKQMLKASRLSAKVSLTELTAGHIYISSAQIFSPIFNLYKITANDKSNFQFVIDSLASKDKTNTASPQIAINSLVVRHGEVVWNQMDAPHKNSFDTNHLKFTNISSHVIVNAIGGDTLNATLKRLAFNEVSGLSLRSLSFNIVCSQNTYTLSDLRLALPHSAISMPRAVYNIRKGGYAYEYELAQSRVALKDISPIVPYLDDIEADAIIKAHITGTDKKINVNTVTINAFSPNAVRDGNIPAINLIANGVLCFPALKSDWNVAIKQFSVNDKGVELFAGKLPDVLTRLRSFGFTGTARGTGDNAQLDGHIISDAGDATVAISKSHNHVIGNLQTQEFDLGKLLDTELLHTLAADISAEGDIKAKTLSVNGTVNHIDYNQYSYKDITIDGYYDNKTIEGSLKINDPNFVANISGSFTPSKELSSIRAKASIDHISPAQLELFKGRLANATYKSEIYADIMGKSIEDATGTVEVRNFSMQSAESNYSLDSLVINAGNNADGHFVNLRSDFGQIHALGKLDFATLKQSFENVIVAHLPSITKFTHFSYQPITAGKFSVVANIKESNWAKALFGIPLELNEPLYVSAAIIPNRNNDKGTSLDMNVIANDLQYGDYRVKGLKTSVQSLASQLGVNISLKKIPVSTSSPNDLVGTDINLSAMAGDDKIDASFGFDNHAASQRLRGKLETNVKLGKDNKGVTQAALALRKSCFNIGDSVFTVYPSTIVYSKNNLLVDNLMIGSSSQGIKVDGRASVSSEDSLIASLYNVNVSYIQDIIGFHSVDFDGALSGTATIKQLFSKPSAHGDISVEHFRFMNGRLGTLDANVAWNNEQGQIDIDALATDTMIIGKGEVRPRTTTVKGYVSPKRNYIDLGIKLKDTRAEFVGELCSSFLSNVNLSGNGNLRLAGDLKSINLTGGVVAQGDVAVTPLGTHYMLRHGNIHFIENEIIFQQDTIYDDLGALGVVSGAIHHKHLGRMTYDIDIAAQNLLAFNLDGIDGSSFYGKVSGTGTATIKGRSGEVEIGVDMMPTGNSEVVYDISSPEALSSQDFITWMPRPSAVDSLSLSDGQGATVASKELINTKEDANAAGPLSNILTNIRLSLAIKATPEAALKIIMDRQTGDYIKLYGSGDLRATYFNKGGISIFGTYTIDHGVYNLTIQNIIKKSFDFAQGGTIVFGGDPYNASLNLRAQYPIASVSLADLQVGRSFSSSNTRVTCLMDITGTPETPKVGFSLDFPTMSSDAKQMVYSLINGEEEMNQQVLYLLAVGRFYSKGVNNAGIQTSQTSLAMQSIVSGQLSQQINNVLSSVMKTNNWNFGANISTGDEGFSNADYEGLLSGRMLNNRLLFNGQFGYRDNANATTSFIGDFDLRYLIFPNGNLSVHVYNQANDRYFTRNTLNTQGIGFIIKKDFGTIGELLNFKKTRRQTKQAKQPKSETKH